MENPQTWGKAEHVVRDAIDDHEEAMSKAVCGLSLVRWITDALRAEGLLKDE